LHRCEEKIFAKKGEEEGREERSSTFIDAYRFFDGD
jgi:hypothetical protein